MPRPHPFSIRLLAALGWFLLTTWLLVIPGNALPKTRLIQIPYFDKWVHVGLFAVLCWLAIRALSYSTPQRITVIVLTSILYGTAMEFVQLYLVANRSFDLVDIMADAMGTLVGALLWIWTPKMRT